DRARVAVHDDLLTVLDIVHAIAGHGNSWDCLDGGPVRPRGRIAAAARIGLEWPAAAAHLWTHPPMITANRPSEQPVRWQQLWRESVTDPRELLALLGLSSHAAGLLPARDTGFAMRVPRGFVARMRPGDPRDPLLLQVLPLAQELAPVAGYGADPLQELGQMQPPGLLQKYHGRALLVASGACAINCRYCFRREFPYAEASVTPRTLAPVLQALAADAGIEEVILSGGDPLALSDQRLAAL